MFTNQFNIPFTKRLVSLTPLIKKVTTLIMGVVLIIFAIGCDEATLKKTYKIGLIYYGQKGTLAKSVLEYAHYLASEFDVEIDYRFAVGNYATLNAVKELCSQRVDAILSYWPGQLQKQVSVCDEYGVYYASFMSREMDNDIMSQVTGNQWYLGGVYMDEKKNAEILADEFYKSGNRKISVISIPPYDKTHNERFSAIINRLESYPDVTIVGTIQGFSLSANVENLISQGLEMDGIISTGTIAFPKNMQERDIKLLKTAYYDFGEFSRDDIANSRTAMVLCGQHSSLGLTFAHVYSVLEGNPLSNKPIDLYCDYISVTNVEEYDNYMNYCIGQGQPFSGDELKQLAKSLNPNAAIDILEQYCQNYSLEDVIERHSR